MFTWETPGRMLIRCATTVEAYLYRSQSVRVSDMRPNKYTAWSFGFVLVNVGGLGRSIGNLPVARWIAACTSVAASVILLLKTNCRVSCVLLCVLLLVMMSKPGICMNCFSNGVAMLLAIVVGSAPG